MDTYTKKADLSLFVDGLENFADIEAPQAVAVEFRVNMEHRAWGIKGIDVTPVRLAPIEFAYAEDADAKQWRRGVVTVDATQLPVETVRGHYITIDDVVLHVSRDGVVDYAKSHCNATMIGA